MSLLAAFLGLSESRIRHIVADHAISPIGSDWKAKLYDPFDIARHAGNVDRLTLTG